MILRAFCRFPLIHRLLAPASAQERVTVGTLRLASNGALFLAAAQGYFKAEGLDVEMTAYPSAQAVVEALSLGRHRFRPDRIHRDGVQSGRQRRDQGDRRAGAREARLRRQRIVASNAGLRQAACASPRTSPTNRLRSARSARSFHYQLGQIARIKRFDLASITLKPLQSLDAMARAVAAGQVDAAILPAQYARELLVANQAKLIGWYSELDEQQLGALFASAKTIETRRATVEKFVRAYRRGAAEYAAALLRHDRYGKRISDAMSQAAAAVIARYVYPGHPAEKAAATVEANAYFVDARAIVMDLSFVK